MNMKQIDPQDLVTHATVKAENVSDGILLQFSILSKLLLEVNRKNQFYCGQRKGRECCLKHALPLMEEVPFLTKKTCNKNILESVLGICNSYSRASATDMFSQTELGPITAIG